MKALLARNTASGATEAEAETAARMAQAILMEYNLSLADAKIDNGDAESVGKYEESFRENAFEGRWKAVLAVAVANANLCRVIGRGRNSGVWFVGTETNARIARDVWQYLAQQIMLQCAAAYRDAWREATPGKYRKEFYWGAVRRLQERLREIKRQSQSVKPDWYKGDSKAYENQTRALIVRNDKDVTAYVRREWPRLSSGSCSVNAGHGPGYAAGRAAADRMNLGRTGQIAGNRRLLG